MSNIDYVNTLQGTASVIRFSHGNTLPLTQLPFGMFPLTVQTRGKDGNFFFHPSDNCIEGMRLAHQPSPWIGDYGTVCIAPHNGEPSQNLDLRYSCTRPQQNVINPDYMKLSFLKYAATLEASPTQRGATFSCSFSKGRKAGIAFYFSYGKTVYHTDIENGKIYVENNGATGINAPEGVKTYFVIGFEDLASSEKIVAFDKDNNTVGENIYAQDVAISLDCGNCEEIHFSVAISYISETQAKLNYKNELEGESLASVRASAHSLWEKYLSRFDFLLVPEDKKKTFYSCLYRSLLFPHKFYEYGENGEIFHYGVEDGLVHKGYMYVDNGMWDTFRTQYPLLAEYYTEDYEKIVKAHINYYRDCGWMPKWLSPNELGVMPGTLIDGVIADAAVRGIISGEDLETAYEGIKKHALYDGDGEHGRTRVSDYIKLGYIPCDDILKTANYTLDYSYGDYCVAVVAQFLGKTDECNLFAERSKNYKNLFDKNVGFIRGRKRDGSFPEYFNPFNWGGEYCEGGAWQNGFFVPHDIEGLAELYGGKEKFIEKLDELFATQPEYYVNTYGCEIHEMAEMAVVDLGQCAISNQPSFHLPFLYAALGLHEKTAQIVKRITEEVFSGEADGFPGDEDNGSMSSWYLWCCLGKYPICPGKKDGFVYFKSIYEE